MTEGSGIPEDKVARDAAVEFYRDANRGVDPNVLEDTGQKDPRKQDELGHPLPDLEPELTEGPAADAGVTAVTHEVTPPPTSEEQSS